MTTCSLHHALNKISKDSSACIHKWLLQVCYVLSWFTTKAFVLNYVVLYISLQLTYLQFGWIQFTSCRAAFSFFLWVLAKSGGCIVSNYCDRSSYIAFCIQFLSWNVKYQVELPSSMQAWKSLIHSQAFNSVGNNINIWHILGCCFRSTSCIYNIWQEGNGM